MISTQLVRNKFKSKENQNFANSYNSLWSIFDKDYQMYNKIWTTSVKNMKNNTFKTDTTTMLKLV